jgi:hypothetical protein
MATTEDTKVREESGQIERRIEEDRSAIRESREKREQQRVLAQRTSKKLGNVRQTLRRTYG